MWVNSLLPQFHVENVKSRRCQHFKWPVFLTALLLSQMGDKDFVEVPTYRAYQGSITSGTHLPSVAGALVVFYHDSESNQTGLY